LFPGLNLDHAAFTLTGMAAFMAGALNAPLAATLLITEWSGYQLLVPLLLTTAAGYALIGRESVLRNQPESRAASPVHIAEYLRGAVQLAGAAIQAAAPRESAPRETAAPVAAPAAVPSRGLAGWFRRQAAPAPPAVPPPVVVEEAPAPLLVEEEAAAAPATLDVANPLPDLLALLSGNSLRVSEHDNEQLYRMPVPAPWIGQAVRDLEWPPQAILVAILREGQVRVPRGATVLEVDDSLVVMADPETYERFALPAEAPPDDPEPARAAAAEGQAG
ncbi:MAG TPA: TrkA C-terminal domain-containing protein, partial [Deinococcales bacterium]|nr:TrkA C-terminal domain-containing protein [Deinococcales bacterium]